MESQRAATVSVIIPVFNRADLVRSAIESVLEQRDVDVEVVVVDDGSVDDSREVVERIAATHTSVRTDGFASNRGVSVARNRAMEMATGEFITFLDSDDRMPPGRLAEQLDELTHVPDGLVVGLQELEIDDAVTPPRSIAATLQTDDSERFYIMSMFGHRTTFDRVGSFLPEYRISQDLEYLIRARDLGVPIVRVPKVWVIRGIYGDNLVNDDIALRQELMQVYRQHHRRQDASETDS